MAKKKSKIKTEKETRDQLMGWARRYGAEAQLLKIFERYDDLLKGARSEEERKAIVVMGTLEVNKFFGGEYGALETGGVTIKEDPRWLDKLAKDAEEALRREANTKKN